MPLESADELLRQYAACDEPERADSLLETLLVEHALPGIRKVVRYKLQSAAEAQDIEDVSSEVLVELVGRLRAMKEQPSEGIGEFSRYTTAAAYHACNEYLRRKYPNRHRLKTRLRYLLNTERSLAIWEAANGGWLCGLRRWQSDAVRPVSIDLINRSREQLSDLPQGRSQMHPADLVSRVFELLGGPMEFDDLVGVMSRIWDIKDPPPTSASDARELESGDPDPTLRMELKQWLGLLWKEIRELPVAQRVALLLNLRTGPAAPAAALLPLTRIASIRQIAEVLEFSPEELAGIWSQLPLEDLAIAERLGVSRQRVINLRKSARERLTRRMNAKCRMF